MIQPENKIVPLREDLAKIVPNKFYTTTSYKRWIVANNLQDAWSQCLEYAERNQTLIVLGETQSLAAGDAMTLFLNLFYKNDITFFSNFIIHLIGFYIDETDKEIDVSYIKQDLIIAGVAEDTLSDIDNLIKEDKMEEVSKDSETPEQYVRTLEQTYLASLQTGPNSQGSIRAYQEWFTEALLYLSDYYSVTNTDYVKFKDTDNSHNGIGLRDNYYRLKGIYNLLMKNAKKQISKKQETVDKTPLVFISHSSEDMDIEGYYAYYHAMERDD